MTDVVAVLHQSQKVVDGRRQDLVTSRTRIGQGVPGGRNDRGFNDWASRSQSTLNEYRQPGYYSSEVGLYTHPEFRNVLGGIGTSQLADTRRLDISGAIILAIIVICQEGLP